VLDLLQHIVLDLLQHIVLDLLQHIVLDLLQHSTPSRRVIAMPLLQHYHTMVIERILLLFLVAVIIGLVAYAIQWDRRLSELPVFHFEIPLRAPAGANPDYIQTGAYFPAGYWSAYWPAYGVGAAIAAQRLLGAGLTRAGRGITH
jgi:hypothetical protein